MKTYSLNLITYLKVKGIEVEVGTEDGFTYYGEYKLTNEATEAVTEYKKDMTLHAFLQEYRDLRVQINNMRTSNE